MKQTICILTLTLLLLSCSSKTSKTSDKVSVDTLQTITADKVQSDIYIEDKSQYDQSFIEGLADLKGQIKLIGNYIITGSDTTYFPEDLTVNKRTTFTASKDNNKFLLTVTRTNLTDINYEFQLIDKDNSIIDSKSGKAILGSGFFLAAEGDIDTEMGGYGSYEYWDKSNNCWFAARIGIGKDDNEKQRAKVNYSCDDKNKKVIDLDECPVLRTE
ncbi:MAG: hypothetical protein RIS47_94 [Bacteroidota bacterium]|jgi:hypothetical protein